MGKRLVTLVTCQWSDMDFETLCKTAKAMGYDGLELAPGVKKLSLISPTTFAIIFV